MPLPLAHVCVGLAIESIKPARNEKFWKKFIWVGFLSILMDVDMVFSLIFTGNAIAFHGEASHSILFALLSAFIYSYLAKRLYILARLGFWKSFSIIFAHALADCFLGERIFWGRIKSFFWPFFSFKSQGSIGAGEVVNQILFGSFSEFYIYIVCILFASFCYYWNNKKRNKFFN